MRRLWGDTVDSSSDEESEVSDDGRPKTDFDADGPPVVRVVTRQSDSWSMMQVAPIVEVEALASALRSERPEFRIAALANSGSLGPGRELESGRMPGVAPVITPWMGPHPVCQWPSQRCVAGRSELDRLRERHAQNMWDKTGQWPTILPEAAVTQVMSQARNAWMEQDEQKSAFDELVGRLGTRDKAKRAMTSCFRSMVKAKYGGYLWLQVVIATGSIPMRMLELANDQLQAKALERQKHLALEAPSSSQGPSLAKLESSQGPAGGGRAGPNHRLSAAKRQRRDAKRMQKAVAAESDKRLYGRCGHDAIVSDSEFARLKDEAEWYMAKASRLSEASGHAYTLDGRTHGTRQVSNFAILLAEYCGELDVDVATGVRRRAARLRER